MTTSEQLTLFGDAPVAIAPKPGRAAAALPMAPIAPGKPRKAVGGLADSFIHPDQEARIRRAYQEGKWCTVWANAVLLGLLPWELLQRLAEAYPGTVEAIEPQYVFCAAGWEHLYISTLPGWEMPYRLPDGSELCVLPNKAHELAAALVTQSGEGIAFQHRGRLVWRDQ